MSSNEIPRHPKKRWRKSRYFLRRFLRSSPDKLIELLFALVIVFFTGMQYWNTASNNESNGQQTNQLIVAAKLSAYAAQENAEASRRFADSASRINDGVSSAVETLGRQAGIAELARETSAIQASAALKATKDLANEAKRSAELASTALQRETTPWLGIEVAGVESVQMSGNNAYFTIRLHDYGRTPAVDVSIALPPQSVGNKYSPPPRMGDQPDLCVQAEQNTQAAPSGYGAGRVVWPEKYEDFSVSITSGRGVSAYIPGCVSYKDVGGGLHHTFFNYRVGMDPRENDGRFGKVHLIGIEPVD